jgi:hypothetical protein
MHPDPDPEKFITKYQFPSRRGSIRPFLSVIFEIADAVKDGDNTVSKKFKSKPQCGL